MRPWSSSLPSLHQIPADSNTSMVSARILDVAGDSHSWRSCLSLPPLSRGDGPYGEITGLFAFGIRPVESSETAGTTSESTFASGAFLAPDFTSGLRGVLERSGWAGVPGQLRTGPLTPRGSKQVELGHLPYLLCDRLGWRVCQRPGPS